MLASRARIHTEGCLSILLPLAICLIATTPAPPAGGPTVAREDTLSTEVSPILVHAPRVTLEEILDRVARGEAHRDSLIHDQAFRTTIRVVRINRAPKPPTVIEEAVYQVYRRRPHQARAFKLREYRERPEKDKDKGQGADVSFGDDFDESIVNFAFQPTARRDFTYSIAGRDLVGGHLIYRIAFRPRSVLDPTMPSGLVWIDTNEFVIVRQEVTFERSPVPLFLRGVDRMVVERQRAGDLWVLSRVLMRATLTFTVPHFGKEFDIAVLFSDYAVNHGLPDSLFTRGGRKLHMDDDE
jgi:hypothetical protein